jgi:uncharacterized protein YbaP (TraB family)
MVTRLFLLWLLLVSTAFADEQGLLWHISGKGVDSYIFGTMHSEDPRVTRLPPEVERHFVAANTLVLEVALDEKTEMEMAVQMMLPPESSLTTLVGETLSRQAKQAMQTRGVPPEVTDRLQLWATVLTLSIPQQQSGLFLDKVLYQEALASGKKFRPLESANEQIAIFTALTLDEQKELLRNVLKDYLSYPVLFEQMTEAYLSRDLSRLMKISDENPMTNDPVLQKKMMMRLLDHRNRRMAARIEPLLSQGKLFIAIGALHLPGEEGVITLLRQRGYMVESIY